MTDDLLDRYEALVRRRRATRHFAADPIAPGLIERLLDITRWSPSGYNLQPTRFVVVSDREIRPALRRACMDQTAIDEAPVLVAFCGDHDASGQFERTLAMDLAVGATTPEYVGLLRRIVPLAFDRGPLGLGWLWKAFLVPLARRFRPIPNLPAVERRVWLAKQSMLSAMNFLLAAEAAGLNTLPMEGFDTGRVRSALGLPRCWEPLLIVAVGHPLPGTVTTKSRLPLSEITLHR